MNADPVMARPAAPSEAAWHARLPRLDPAQLAAHNRRYAAGTAAELSAGARRVRLAWRALAPDAPRPPAGPVWHFAVEWAGLRAEVLADTLDPWMPGIDESTAGADDAVRRAVAEQVLAVWAVALGLGDESVPRVLPVRASAAAAPALAWRVEDPSTGSGGHLVLAFDQPEAMDAALRLWQRLAPPAPAGAVPIPLRFRIGHSRLAGDEVARLRAGDVILLDRLPTQGGRWQALLLAGAARAPLASGTMQGDSIVLQRTDPAAATAAPLATDTLGVELSFEIGRTTLPLAALARLAPGYVFELGAMPEGDIVEITSQGRTLGLGRLVLVGDAVGVRVSRVQLDEAGPAAARHGQPA